MKPQEKVKIKRREFCGSLRCAACDTELDILDEYLCEECASASYLSSLEEFDAPDTFESENLYM